MKLQEHLEKSPILFGHPNFRAAFAIVRDSEMTVMLLVEPALVHPYIVSADRIGMEPETWTDYPSIEAMEEQCFPHWGIDASTNWNPGAGPSLLYGERTELFNMMKEERWGKPVDDMEN